MHGMRTNPLWAALRVAGSLWFGAMLLTLLLVAMACATVHESTYSAERALTDFYQSWWFQALLGFMALNVAAAVVVRYPFNRRQIGFIITHGSILLILGGALVTQKYGVEGDLVLAEGETGKTIVMRDDALSVVNRSTSARADVRLVSSDFRSVTPVDRPRAAIASLGGARVEIVRFVPDAVASERLVNDNPVPRAAVEFTVAEGQTTRAKWLFDGQTTNVGGQILAFRELPGEEQLQAALAEPAGGPAVGSGVVKAKYKGQSISAPLDDCMKRRVSIGDTGLTLQVTRYFADAVVGPDKRLMESSGQPNNPAIEMEIVGPNGTGRRVAFARFPDFQSKHPSQGTEDLAVTFETTGAVAIAARTEILVASGGIGSYVRRVTTDGSVSQQSVHTGDRIELPGSTGGIVLTRRLDHARVDRIFEPFAGQRENRWPALEVAVTGATSTATLWLEKHRPYPVTIDGTPFELAYSVATMPLGFDVMLNRFTVGRYPGEGRPRSFESQITITDAVSGRSQGRVISMNHPTSFGGFNFFQSSYQMDGRKVVSILSVSRDPGQPIVFTGYVTLILGMITVLATRVSSYRGGPPPSNGRTAGGNGRTVNLLGDASRCMNDGPRVATAWAHAQRTAPVVDERTASAGRR